MLHTKPVWYDSASAWNMLNICMPQTTLLIVGLIAVYATCSVVLEQESHCRFASETGCHSLQWWDGHVCLYCTLCMLHETAWNSSVYMAVPCAHL